MEAFSTSPVTASHQTAKPQGPRGLGDIFAALLQEAAIRLDARPADPASLGTHRPGGEAPRRISAAETISSLDSRGWRDDAGSRSYGVENDANAARDPIETIPRAEDYAEVTDDGDFAARAPEDDVEPSAAAGNAAPGPNQDDIQLTPGEDAEAPVAQDAEAPVTDEIAAPVAGPVQAQSVAVAADLGAAQARATFAVQARATTQSQVPAQAAPQAQAASIIVPAAGQPGIKVGATRVQITPAPVVAQPNATLGGNAAVAALAAEAGQAAARNAAQNPPASLPNAASETAANAAGQAALQPAKPGNRTGLNGPVAGGTGAAIAQNAGGLPPVAQGAVAAVEATASGLQGQSQGATGPAAGESDRPIPQNAPTAFAGSNPRNADNSRIPGSQIAATTVSEAGVRNRLGQTARTDTAQALAAPLPGADGADGAEGSHQPGASRAATGTTQGARPAGLESNQNNATQNNTAQTARAEGPAQVGVAAQAGAQNAPSGTAAAAERAMAPASVRRSEGAGPANLNNPMAAGMPGLTLAAARTPPTLPAQARPAASLPANQVAVHIQRAVAAGQSRISISLHPAELGQIDVKLNIGNDGAVKAIISIERPETFELLQRDARGLEKALQDAGLKTDSGSLSFNLKGQSERDAAAGGNGPETGSHDAERDTPAEPELAPDIIAAANASGAERILDLHV